MTDIAVLLDGLIEVEEKYRQTVNAHRDETEVAKADKRLKLLRQMRHMSNGTHVDVSDEEEDTLKRDIEALAEREWCANDAGALVHRFASQ